MTAPMLDINQLSEGMINPAYMKRLGKPEEFADAVLFLSSDRATFITAEPVRIYGG